MEFQVIPVIDAMLALHQKPLNEEKVPVRLEPEDVAGFRYAALLAKHHSHQQSL
jgi:hypothetical protein